MSREQADRLCHFAFHLAAINADAEGMTDAEAAAQLRKARDEVRAYARKKKIAASGLRVIKPAQKRGEP